MMRLGRILTAFLLTAALPAMAGSPLNLVPLELIEQNVGDESGVQSFALADLDGDGLLDMVVIDIDSAEIVAFTGEGDGTFTDRRLVGPGELPLAVAVADVTSPFITGGDVDGIPDVIVVDELVGLQIFIGRGDGTFDEPDQTFEDLDTAEISAVAVSDFDGDGRGDLAVLEAIDGVYFLCNDAGTFQPCPTPVVFLDEFSFELSGLAVGDYDGGGLDVAVIDADTGEMYVIYGNGDGSFDEVFDAVEIGPIGIELRAVRALPPADGEEEPDSLFVLSYDPFADPPSATFSRFVGDPVGGGFTRTDFPAGEVGNAFVLEDIDGDERRDVTVVGVDDFEEVAASNFLRGTATGFAAPASIADVLTGGRALEAADLDGDDKIDLVAVTADGAGLQVLLNDSVPPPACNGDCDGNGVVAINELIRAVNIALGNADVSTCTAVDRDGNGTVSISELVAAVNSALDGCPE